MNFAITFLIFVFSSGLNPSIDEVPATVISVIDGNTIEIESNENGKQKIVLSGIDSPELNQEYGSESKRFLEKLLLKKEVIVEFKGKDRWGNHLAVVMLADDDVRISMLKEGLSWTVEKISDTTLEGYCLWAQKKGKGLWKTPNPTPPWVFRRQHSMQKPKSR